MTEAAQLAKESFDFVLEHGMEIVYDHHIVYQTRTLSSSPWPIPYIAVHFVAIISSAGILVSDARIVDYELGRLESRNGNKDEARRHIELVLSGKVLGVTWNGRKGQCLPHYHESFVICVNS
jgi:hypothetical protein